MPDQERSPTAKGHPHLASPSPAALAATVDEFRRLAIWLVFASSVIAIALAIIFGVRVDPRGTFALNWMIAAVLLISRIYWNAAGHHRIADAFGTVAVVSLGAMSCGAIAMLGLRLQMPLADGMLHSWDQALGVDGIAIVDALVRNGRWLFWIMAPAYNFTIPLFFIALGVLALRGDRVEAWRAAFCFVATLFTTCLIAAFVPAKGLGIWAPAELLARLPDQAMRTFWPHFDDFYFAAHPVLRMQVVDGVIAFPSFHSIVGFMIVAMLRKNNVTLVPAALWLAAMLLATFPGGGHYFVDLVGGLVVWAAWFAVSLRMERSAALSNA
ncbi:MAG: phosphatase PAP2 family protein [Sphingomicrobium sp.]